MIRRVVVLALATTVAFGLAACGGGDDQATTAAQSSGGDAAQTTTNEKPSGGGGVAVVAEDIRFPEHTYSATAGEVAISYRNEGAIGHTLVIDGADGFKLDVPAHGDVDKATVELQPGEYTLYCDVPGHRQAGMEATLEVR